MQPNSDYTHAGHLLTGVPQAVLEDARVVLRSAAHLGEVDGDLAEPLADAVLMAIVPYVTEWRPMEGDD